jgi:TP901 family phage tail tape measure protein
MITVAQLIARLSVETTGFMMGMAAAQGKLEGTAASMMRFGRTMTQMGRFLTVGLTVPITVMGYEAVKMANNFASAMLLIRTQGGASIAEVNNMSTAVLKMVEAGHSFGYSAVEMANALRDIEFEGLRGKNALEVLHVAAAGARLGNADLKTVTDALTGAMIAFQVPVKQMPQLMATLNAGVGQGRMTIEDLSKAMSSNLMPAARGLGISVSQMVAALDVFTSKNVPAAAAANKLTTAFLKMAIPTKQAIGISKEMGFTFESLTKALQEGGLPGALKILSDAYENYAKKVGSVHAGAELAAAFGGSRTGASIASLVQSYEQYMKRLDAINRTASIKTFWQTVAQAMNIPANKIKSAVQSIGASLTSMGQTLAPVIATLARWMAELARRFDEMSPRAQRFVLIGLAIAAAIGPAMIIIGGFASLLSTLIPIIAAVASPIGALVAALAVLVGAVVAAEYAPKQFIALLEKFGLSAQQAKSVVAVLRQIFDDCKAVILAFVTVAKTMWATFGTEITAVARAAWTAVQAVIKAALEVIKGVINIAMGLIKGDWSRVWEGIKQVFQGTWNAIVALAKYWFTALTQAAKAMGVALLAVFTGMARLLVNAGEAIIKGLWAGMKIAWNTITGWVSKIGAFIRSLMGGAAGWLVSIGEDIINGLWQGMKNAWNKVTGWVSSLGGWIASHKGPPSADAVLLFNNGVLIIGGLVAGMISQMPKVEDAAYKAAATIVDAMSKATKGSDKLFARVGDSIKRMMETMAVQGDILDAARTLGLNAAISIAKGVIGGTPTIEQQVKAALKAAVKAATDAAAQAVTDARSKFTSAFDTFLSAALSAFDAWASKIKTKTEILLQQMADAASAKQLAQAVTDSLTAMNDAQSAFNAALGDAGAAGAAYLTLLTNLTAAQEKLTADLAAGADAATIAADKAALAAAQGAVQAAGTTGNKDLDAKLAAEKSAYDALIAARKAYQDALDAMTTADEQKQAAKERVALDKRLALKRIAFEKELKALEAHLAKEGATWTQSHEAILKLFAKFGLAYKTWGDKFGEAIAQGLRDSLPSIEAAAAAIAAAIAKYLKLGSPAEKGPLSDLDKWWNKFVPTLMVGFRPQDLDKMLNDHLAFTQSAGTIGAMANVSYAIRSGGGAYTGGPTYKIELSNPTFIGTDLRKAAEELWAPLKNLDDRYASRQGFINH